MRAEPDFGRLCPCLHKWVVGANISVILKMEIKRKGCNYDETQVNVSSYFPVSEGEEKTGNRF